VYKQTVVSARGLLQYFQLQAKNSRDISRYKVVQIWPGQTVTCLHTNSPGHIWTILYNHKFFRYSKIVMYLFHCFSRNPYRYSVEPWGAAERCLSSIGAGGYLPASLHWVPGSIAGRRCGICGGQTGTRMVFLGALPFPLSLPFHSTSHSHFTHLPPTLVVATDSLVK
jgi:hypothetical protein